MHQSIAPIAVRPWALNGLSERLLVSHYEHHYGSAVRRVNAVRLELDARYVRGGLSAWYAAGGARAMRPAEDDA